MADLNIGNSTANVIVNAKHNGTVNPQINNTYDLGTSDLRWKNIYGNLKGNADTATTATNLASAGTWTWTGGTTAGPTASLVLGGKTTSIGAIPSASASASGIITTGTQTIAGEKTFTSNLLIKKSTPNLCIIDTSTGVDTYSIIRFGNTNASGTTNANAAYIFLNGPQRAEDGGANLMTIRNNVGDLKLGNDVINTGKLTVGQATKNTNYTLSVNGTSRFNNTLYFFNSIGDTALSVESRRSKNSSNANIETITGLVTKNKSFVEIRGFAPPTMVRTTGDRPAPYGLGFNNGAESAGIMPIGEGDKLQELMFYGANSGPTLFTWKHQTWDDTNYDSDTSNGYSTAMMSLNSKTGDLYVKNTIGINGQNTSYNLYVNGTAYFNNAVTAPTFNGNASTANGLKIQDILNSQEKIDEFLVADSLQYAIFSTPEQNNIGMRSNDGMIISIPWEKTNRYGAQIAIDDEKNGVIKFRAKNGNWGSWFTLLHSGNYNDYAATTTIANHLESFDTRSTNSTPSELRKGFHLDFKSNGTNGLHDGGDYNGVLSWRSYGSATDLSGGLPIQIAYTSNGNLWTRMGASADTWGTWAKILTNANYTGTLDGRYVNASGDTMTGTLGVPQLYINNPDWENDTFLRFREGGSEEYGAFIAYGSGDTFKIGTRDGGTDYRAISISRGSTSVTVSGNLSASKVYGAVWNDYAEYRSSNITEPGRVVIENGDGTLSLSTERLQRGAEIISDTFGFAIGETDKCKTPIAVSGRVLAYYSGDIKEFKPGYPVCSGPNGTVSVMTEEEEEKYPSRIIGTVSEIPTYEKWGTGNVEVNGRIWIRIR